MLSPQNTVSYSPPRKKAASKMDPPRKKAASKMDPLNKMPPYLPKTSLLSPRAAPRGIVTMSLEKERLNAQTQLSKMVVVLIIKNALLRAVIAWVIEVASVKTCVKSMVMRRETKSKRTRSKQRRKQKEKRLPLLLGICQVPSVGTYVLPRSISTLTFHNQNKKTLIICFAISSKKSLGSN